MAAVRGGFPTNQSRPADRLGEALLGFVRVKKPILRYSSVARARDFESCTANNRHTAGSTPATSTKKGVDNSQPFFYIMNINQKRDICHTMKTIRNY